MCIYIYMCIYIHAHIYIHIVGVCVCGYNLMEDHTCYDVDQLESHKLSWQTKPSTTKHTKQKGPQLPRY